MIISVIPYSLKAVEITKHVTQRRMQFMKDPIDKHSGKWVPTCVQSES